MIELEVGVELQDSRCLDVGSRSEREELVGEVQDLVPGCVGVFGKRDLHSLLGKHPAQEWHHQRLRDPGVELELTRSDGIPKLLQDSEALVNGADRKHYRIAGACHALQVGAAGIQCSGDRGHQQRHVVFEPRVHIAADLSAKPGRGCDDRGDLVCPRGHAAIDLAKGNDCFFVRRSCKAVHRSAITVAR